MSGSFSRREFMKSAVAAGTMLPASEALLAPTSLQAAKSKSPNEKLNLGVIGVANRGGANLNGVSGENIVVLCDIDAKYLAGAAKRFPKAKICDDYRKVFDQKNLDGVVVSTPDHFHAIAVARGLREGLAVYCEKPLTHSIHEARTLSRLTAETKAVTQMGNQIHNHPRNNYRRVVELVQSGVIGKISRVHVWQGGGVRSFLNVKTSKPPAHINYDLWLGPAPYRPYSAAHLPFNWRFWWDFGGGQLADFVCHYMDLPYWALKLKYPKTIVAVGEKDHDGDNECPNKMKVDYHFEKRGDLPPVHVTWYHGGWKPKGAEVYKKGSAVLFEGTEGRLLADYTTKKLFLEADKQGSLVKVKIKDSIGHHAEWIEAVKKGPGTHTTCNFQYGALLSEAGHLGNISYRVGQKKLEWDAHSAVATNCPEANELVRREYRKGWTL
jgi:predicted dehydrogenase